MSLFDIPQPVTLPSWAPAIVENIYRVTKRGTNDSMP